MIHKPNNKIIRVVWRILVIAALVTVVVWLITTNWNTVHTGIVVAEKANPALILLAVCAMALTWPIAAVIYRILALHPLKFGEITTIETATSFANRLLPAGTGGLGLHGLYLYKREHTVADATVVVSINNLIGILAHLSLLILVVIFYPSVVHELRFNGVGVEWQWVFIIPLLFIVLLAIPLLRRKVTLFAHNLLSSFRKFHASTVFRAYLIAMVLTLTYVVALWCTARSVGVTLSFVELFIVFSAGMLAATATPTPGGLVGAEAGLFAGLVAYKISVTDAAAVVLLFRFVTYWLPIIPGFVALLVARRKNLV